MKSLMSFLKKFQKQLRIIVNSKKIILVICVVSFFITLFLAKFINSMEVEEDNSLKIFYDSVMKDKKAVSVILSTRNIPIELLYPGIKVDLIEKSDDNEINYIVRDVFIISISVLGGEEKARVVLALNDFNSKKVLSTKSDSLRIILRGEEGSKNTNDIEIVEL